MNHLTIYKHRVSSYLRAYKAPLHLSRELYKSTPFMQNKPNFRKSQMNLSSVLTREYENKSNWTLGENKPNLKPIKPNFKANFRKAKMNATPILTKDYENIHSFSRRQNKPNSNPILPAPKRAKQKSDAGLSEKWNLYHASYDLYYRIMPKRRDQIYDELLVIKCQQGDSRAFDELVGRWQKRLWHYAFGVTGSESAAWDIVQETWVGVIKGIRKLQDVSVFPQWAFIILNNKCADLLRTKHLQSQLDKEFVKQLKNESDKRHNSDQKVESLRTAIERLAPDRRALLTLRYYQGFDIGQIAEILSVPEGTVKSRLHRTINELRQLVERD